jgi:hypothetical protein
MDTVEDCLRVRDERKAKGAKGAPTSRHDLVARPEHLYNHPDLLQQIRAESTHPAPKPAPATPEPATRSGIVSALREQLRTQQQRYEADIADLKAENKRLERALAAAHGELHRRGHTGPHH